MCHDGMLIVVSFISLSERELLLILYGKRIHLSSPLLPHISVFFSALFLHSVKTFVGERRIHVGYVKRYLFLWLRQFNCLTMGGHMGIQFY